MKVCLFIELKHNYLGKAITCLLQPALWDESGSTAESTSSYPSRKSMGFHYYTSLQANGGIVFTLSSEDDLLARKVWL